MQTLRRGIVFFFVFTVYFNAYQLFSVKNWIITNKINFSRNCRDHFHWPLELEVVPIRSDTNCALFHAFSPISHWHSSNYVMLPWGCS